MATRIRGPVGVRIVGPGLPLDVLLSMLPSLPRPELERLTQRAIDRMDRDDGDPDLEPDEDQCEAGDDGCGVHHNGRGHTYWGSDQADRGVLFPSYGIDQTKEPKR